jgi:hypothetical protein
MVTVTGGDKFREKLQGIGRQITNASAVKVGFLAESTYPDGTPVAMIAAIQEYGAPNNRMFGGPPAPIPPRPFFRNMIRAKKKEWPNAIRVLLRDNNYDALRTLQQTGEAVAGQLRQSIVDTNSPALKPSTLRMRGVAPGTKYKASDPTTYGAKPLVHTGVMLQSVSYEIKA